MKHISEITQDVLLQIAFAKDKPQGEAEKILCEWFKEMELKRRQPRYVDRTCQH